MSILQDTGKNAHSRCTGIALETVNHHTQDEDITLFASCFCPFSQRVWATLESLGIPYKYYEVDPNDKPKELLELSPKGLVPALKLNRYTPPRALNESTVIMEYLEDLASNSTKGTLLPPPTDSYARALVRLQSDYVNRTLLPAFYRFLLAQDKSLQVASGTEFHAAIETLVTFLERAEREVLGGGGAAGEGERRALGVGLGLWIEGGRLGWVDVMVGPCISFSLVQFTLAHRTERRYVTGLYRASNVLKHYRGFVLPGGDKFNAWIERLFGDPAFRATCSTDELYIDSFERYAFNRPNTSQIANAINSGKGLP